MTGTITPGAYLKRCRQRALLSIAEIAAKIATEPHSAEHDRAEWLALIEADATPVSFGTIVALRRMFSFDLVVLAKLEALRQGWDIPAPALCRICACSDRDACSPACAWAEPDLCSACATPPAEGLTQ